MTILFLGTRELVNWNVEMQWFQENTATKCLIQVHQDLKILRPSCWWLEGQQQSVSRKESKLVNFYVHSPSGSGERATGAGRIYRKESTGAGRRTQSKQIPCWEEPAPQSTCEKGQSQMVTLRTKGMACYALGVVSKGTTTNLGRGFTDRPA